MKEFSRREVVAGSAATALTVAANPAQAREPKANYPHENHIKLDCAFIDKVFDGVKVRLRAYNNQIPGPTMRIYPGQRVHITLKNSLPPYDSTGWNGNHNVPHHLDWTNLHLHGMDIIPHLFEPLGTSDPMAPMIHIEPGKSKEYVFDIPHDHEPGLNWYHPHSHGSTAVQAVSGMAGGIIVPGAIDDVPEIKAAKQYLIVMQDIGLFPSDEPGQDDIWTYLPKQNAIWQTFAGNVTIYNPKKNEAEPTELKGGFTTGDYKLRFYLVNGEPYFREDHNSTAKKQTEPLTKQLAPMQIKAAPGEVIFIRMLNGNSDNYMPIAVEGHEMHLIAYDGVNFPEVRTIAPTPIIDDPLNEGQIQLAPANRAEFLIKASMTPGKYRIVQLQQHQQFLFSAEKVIAEIEVAGTPKTMALPSKLPIPTRDYPLIKPSEIEHVRVINFAGQFPGTKNPVVGIDFLINGEQYSQTQVRYVVDLGSAEQWYLEVGDSAHGGTEGHPFHIHVNSFEVISVNGRLQPPGTIKDVVWVPQNSTVVIRMRYQTFVGKSVFHCHILPHEDTGMMQNFLIKRHRDPVPEAILMPEAPTTRVMTPAGSTHMKDHM
jgi:FtsP/CotA-like multicopper oxidase with cupredoxin domain